jgi:hypothetical protein
VAFTLGPGNHAEIAGATALPDKCPAPTRLPAGKGHDAKAPARPSGGNRNQGRHPLNQIAQNPHPPRYRSLPRQEPDRARLRRIKDRRRIATRNDKRAINFASAVAIAAIILWWT